MIDWERIAEINGHKDVKEMLLCRYAQTHEQRKGKKLSIRGLACLFIVSEKSISDKLKELGISRAPSGGPNFKPRIIDASKFGFKTEDELLKHWRYVENKSIKEIYQQITEHFGEVSWDWFRRKLTKLGIVKKGTRLEGRLWETSYEKDKGTRYYSDFV